MIQTRSSLFILLVFFLFASCTEKPIPKPYGYFRIDFPDKKYLTADTISSPYLFEYPWYAVLTPYRDPSIGPYWFDLNFPLQNAQLHLSYLPVRDNLRFLLDESHALAFKHQIKSNAIEDELILRPNDRKYGLVYHIRGNAASPIQFFITDSTQHFLRGSLYFLHSPNSDSIAPVLQFIEEDIFHLIETLQWKKVHD